MRTKRAGWCLNLHSTYITARYGSTLSLTGARSSNVRGPRVIVFRLVGGKITYRPPSRIDVCIKNRFTLHAKYVSKITYISTRTRAHNQYVDY